MAAWKRKRLPGHTPERERSEQTGWSLHTLRKWRKQGQGQAYIKIGREIHYVDADEPRRLASLKKTPARRPARECGERSTHIKSKSSGCEAGACRITALAARKPKGRRTNVRYKI
jgi:hypothetical protein